MSSPYLRCVIREQINRAQSLKDAIPSHLGHASLERLAAMCRGALEEQSRLLERANSLRDGDDGAEVLKVVKRCTKIITTIEGYAMPPLHCPSKQAVFLNDVLSAMHAEACLPFPCPAVSCTSDEHYFTHRATNTVHAPLSEAEFLLHMPDFYHELGHLLFEYSLGTKCQPVLDGITGANEAVEEQYVLEGDTTEDELAPSPVRDSVKWMWYCWRWNWVQESFCDLFALFAAGPAYAYSNLHLVSKSDLDMYKLNLMGRQDHPSGEARMRLLDAGMHALGHGREAKHVREEWDKMAKHSGDPPQEYDLAFPSVLLQKIAAAVLPAFEKAGLRGYAGGDGARGGAGDATVAALLNDAWRGFWREEGGGFRDLEKTLVSRLAGLARSRCDASC